MDIIFVLITLVLIILIVGIYFFFWAVNSDQFEDFDSPAHHVIMDDKKHDINRF